MNERLENVLREILQRNEAIHNLLAKLLDEKAASNEAKKKGTITFGKNAYVSFIANKTTHVGCLSSNLLLTDNVAEFYLYTDVDSDKVMFCLIDGNTSNIRVNIADITNMRYSNDSEIALFALICAKNEVYFDEKTHKVYPYKIQRAKQGEYYYCIFNDNNSFDVTPCTDTYSATDDKRFIEGNYFLSKDEAIDFITSCHEDKLKERSLI